MTCRETSSRTAALSGGVTISLPAGDCFAPDEARNDMPRNVIANRRALRRCGDLPAGGRLFRSLMLARNDRQPAAPFGRLRVR
jgi:hypothetical protein